MGIKICPQCGGKVSDTRNDCPHCQYDFTSVKKCPDCEEQIDVALGECPVCGHVFEKETSTKTATPPSVAKEETKIQEQQTTQSDDSLSCPYCDSTVSIPIGNDLYMCTVCKNKFMDKRGLPTPPPYIPKAVAESKSTESIAPDNDAETTKKKKPVKENKEQSHI